MKRKWYALKPVDEIGGHSGAMVASEVFYGKLRYCYTINSIERARRDLVTLFDIHNSKWQAFFVTDAPGGLIQKVLEEDANVVKLAAVERSILGRLRYLFTGVHVSESQLDRMPHPEYLT